MPDDYARLRDRMYGWRDEDRDEFRRAQAREHAGREGRDFGGHRDDRHADHGGRYGSSRNYAYGSSQGEERFRDRGGHGGAGPLSGDHEHRAGRDDRGFFERAGDEMATWFGSESAERRRERDGLQGDAGAQHHRGRGPSGYRRSDARIAEDINDRLTEDAFIDASEVQVRVENGEVTLDGTVDSRMARRRSEDLAEAIAGVTHVQNNLRVGRQGGPSGGTGRAGGTGPTAGVGTGGTAGTGGSLGTAGTAGTKVSPETGTPGGTTAGSAGTTVARRMPD